MCIVKSAIQYKRELKCAHYALDLTCVFFFFADIVFNCLICQLSIWRAKSTENSCPSSVEMSRTKWITETFLLTYSKRLSCMKGYWLLKDNSSRNIINETD